MTHVRPILLLFFLLLFLAVSGSRPHMTAFAQSPSVLVPTIYCIGGSGIPPCAAFPSPTEPVVSVSPTATEPSVTPSTTQTTISPVATIDPCENGATSALTNRGKHHHKWHRGGGGFFEMLFQFLLKLIELFLGGSGTPPPGNPSPSPTPSTVPVPSITMTPSVTTMPSVAPCPSITTVVSPVPSIGLVPTEITPSLAPSQTTQLPSQILNLTNWKLQLPAGQPGNVTEITQPTLATYTNDPWFLSSGSSVRFRAPVNGVTTSGSEYPRSELREMTNNGSTQASWSTATGTHTMTLDEAITAVPKTRKIVVAGQIHDGTSDVIQVRLEYPKLFIAVGQAYGAVTGPTLDANYTLGKRFTIKAEVTGGKTNVYYNGGTTPIYTLSKSYATAYFKAGAYTQSNCTKEAAADCTANNYGEVLLYNVTVTHN